VEPPFPVVLEPIGGAAAPVVPPEPGVPAADSSPPPLPVVLEAQLDVVIVFVSRFTAPVLASSRPWIVAAVFAVIVVRAITVPTKLVPVPSVAEDPTSQNTLHACAPLMSETLVLEPVISVEPIWKMNTAAGLPWASSVTLPDDSSSELLAVRTPGRNT
jgi:hypothetical protein